MTDETPLLEVRDLTKTYDNGYEAVKGVSFSLPAGKLVGLIGPNGCGKTTMMRCINKMHPITSGDVLIDGESVKPLTPAQVARKVSNVPAEMTASFGLTVFETVMLGRYPYLQNMWWETEEDESEVEDALEKFGVKHLQDRPLGMLSSGERQRVLIAKAFVQNPRLMLVDEPTSHLDIDTIEWLEDYMIASQLAFLVVSHDRYFLDKMTSRMVEIENGKTREYKGNYSDFIVKKMIDINRQEKEYLRYTQNKKQQEKIAAQMHHDMWYSATYKTREKMIDKMEVKEKPVESREITVRIEAAHKSGKNVFTMKDCSISYGGKDVLKHVNLEIHKGDRIGVFGANGQGKSTLVKAMIGEIPCEGDLWIAPGAKIGYYSQHHDDLDLRLTAEEQVLQIIGKDRRADARNLLARFFLYGEEVSRPMSTLSGGQRCRVALTILLLKETNVLVLDEPTNYLDIPARHAIEEALKEYGGTIIAVTHDRYFLDSVCTKVIEVKDGHAEMHTGTYSQLKGRPNITEIVMDADEYRVLAPFTNWSTGMKYKKGDRVLVAPNEIDNYQWAIDQGKIKKTGGRQRKKVAVKTDAGDGKK